MKRTDEQRDALEKLRAIWPDKADEVERLLSAEPDDVKRAAIKIGISARYRLEKFDGEYLPGMTPVEVIEGSDLMGDTR